MGVLVCICMYICHSWLLFFALVVIIVLNLKFALIKLDDECIKNVLKIYLLCLNKRLEAVKHIMMLVASMMHCVPFLSPQMLCCVLTSLPNSEPC